MNKSGSALGDLTGTYPAPTIAALAVTAAKIANATITDTQVAATNKDGTAGTASMRTLGTGAQQACAGNDSRLSDSRTPSGAAGGDLTGTYPNPTIDALKVTTAKINDLAVTTGKIALLAVTDAQVAAANKDGAAGTASMRTLSTTSTTACAGNDSRLSDSRAPNGSASGDLGGSFPSPTVTAIHETSGPTKLTIGSITDGQNLIRTGTTLVGATGLAPGGAAGGDLSGTYPNPSVAAIHETGGPTQLTYGAIADGNYLVRSGTTVIGTTNPFINGFRLTGTTATPVMTADSTALSTIYLTPFKGQQIALYNGTTWDLLSSAEVSIAVSGRTTDLPFDIFAYNSAGTVTLELLDWTSATARATALVRQNGVWCKTGALTRRWVGTCRARSATTFSWVRAGSLAPARLDLFNADNRVAAPFSVIDTTDSWTYNSATWRQARASTNNQVDIMVGLQEEGISVILSAMSSGATTTRNNGIGFDSTTAFTGLAGMQIANSAVLQITAYLNNLPTIGRHYYAWLEVCTAQTATFYGDNGALLIQSGMTGMWTC